MRLVLSLFLVVFLISCCGCASSGVLQAANAIYNIAHASKVAKKSFSNDNVQKVKNDIKATAQKTVNDLTMTGDQMAARAKQLAETLKSGMSQTLKHGRPSIRINGKRKLMLRVRDAK